MNRSQIHGIFLAIVTIIIFRIVTILSIKGISSALAGEDAIGLGIILVAFGPLAWLALYLIVIIIVFSLLRNKHATLAKTFIKTSLAVVAILALLSWIIGIPLLTSVLGLNLLR